MSAVELARPPAEYIAAVVADIRAGRTHHPAAIDEAGILTSLKMLTRAQQPQPVVDCTAIFNMQRVAESVALYDDHPQLTPPWEDALLAYVNTHGNVVCLQVHRNDWDGNAPKRTDWYTENEVDWSQVRWVAETAVWVGGQSGDGRAMPTSGPCHLFRHAIRTDGAPEDINFISLMAPRGQRAERADLIDENKDVWDGALITLGAALNFLNASNIATAEPARPRAVRRRIERTGVTVQAIVVRPPGKHRARSGGVRPMEIGESVLSSVRGHWARYGVDGRGLLFGKYAGKFWIPAHVRGADEAPQRDYVLKPGARQKVGAR